MDAGSFAAYLAGLGEAALAGLLRARPDVLIEPAPRGFAQLAQRLSGPDSLSAALGRTNRDGLRVGQAIAALGPEATVPALVSLLDGPAGAVRAGAADLCARGLAWTGPDGRLCLPQLLMQHWSAEIGGGRPAELVARTALVDQLRDTARALGVEVAGLRKPELAARVTAALSDIQAVAAVITALPKPARDRLDQLRRGVGEDYYFGFPASRPRPGADAERRLAAAGLLLRAGHGWELPWEVAAAGWLAAADTAVTGPPDVAPAAGTPAETRPAARAAVHSLLHGVTALLDQAGATAITALKRGGVGARERAKLAGRLSLPTATVTLAIDLAHAAGLLDRADAGYAPTGAYPDWRAAAPGDQWAGLVLAWLRLNHAPTVREIDGDKELPPPLPLASGAGLIRRALLRAAEAGASVSGVAARIDWYCPLPGYDDARRAVEAGAAAREAELLGVVAADRITECGQHLFDTVDGDAAAGGDAGELARRVGGLLPAVAGSVIVQSDLTAVVSGTPSASAARLLAAAAVSEARGPAGVWRFTAASVRTALDSGWSAGELLTGLAELSDRPLPQPLEYLVKDTARRHGQVRVRGLRCCVIADEATIAEISHTRSLAKLGLARLAPTVLSSPAEPADVLARLRAAGFAPVAEDADGAVIVSGPTEHRAPARPAPTTGRGRLPAAELAALLRADPPDPAGSGPRTGTLAQLAGLNPNLDDMELELLADAVNNARDVLITYRDKNGTRSVREIQPREVYGRWLDSWCHLRNADREFTVANIESVSPPAASSH